MKCQRDCPGTIQDGYCDTCGMAPAEGRPAPSQRTATAQSTRTSALSTRTGGSARTGSARTGSRRRRFGGGLVDVEPMPQRDPATAIMATAEVPEDKRY